MVNRDVDSILKIYGDGQSGNCLKVLWVARFLGLDYSWTEIDVLAGQAKTPGFLALNPAAQVPCIVLDDGAVLAQSNAILLYLAEGSRLIPTDAYPRAKMLEWLFWEQYSHEPYIAVVRFQRHMAGLKPEATEPKLMQRGYAALDRMELALADSAYLVGSVVSLADLSLVAYTRLAHQGGFDLAHYPLIRSWIKRVELDFNITD
jgi:glutathione S-transferase